MKRWCSAAEPEAEWNQIDIAAFCAFFAHPARFLLNRRLGLYLKEEEAALEENEPFALDKLSEYAVKQDLITRLLGGRDSAQAYPVLKASGKLPHGAPGKSVYDDLAAATTNFTGKISPYVAVGPLKAIDVDTVIDGFRLTGRLENVYPQGLVSYRLATVKARDRLGAWIRHLIFNHVSAGQTIVIGEDKAFRYPPLADASHHLAVLFALYGQGLCHPLHFFPESSALFAAATLKGKDAAEALRSAQGKWDAFAFPERDDPYYRLCFGRSDPLDDEFRRLAEAIFHPLLENEEAIR